MKIIVIALSFFLSALTASVPLLGTSVFAADPEPVVDSSGNSLQAGVQYYVSSGIIGHGGGLAPKMTNPMRPCPLYVVQLTVDHGSWIGTPITIHPIDPRDTVIRESTNVNIIHGFSAYCRQSLVWRLRQEKTGLWFVSTNGDVGNSDLDAIPNWFKIEMDNSGTGRNGYKLVFCPTELVPEGLLKCNELGIYIDQNGVRHLALADDRNLLIQFRLFFRRADESSGNEMGKASGTDVLRTLV